MRNLILALMLTGTLMSCEKKRTDSACEDKICTEEFRSLTIKFVDKNGLFAEVKNFSVVNQRTGENIYANSAAASNLLKGVYIIVDDGNIKSLSEKGDDLKITGTSVSTNQTKSAIINVKGGECACHIIKVSGPEQIAFD